VGAGTRLESSVVVGRLVGIRSSSWVHYRLIKTAFWLVRVTWSVSVCRLRRNLNCRRRRGGVSRDIIVGGVKIETRLHPADLRDHVSGSSDLCEWTSNSIYRTPFATDCTRGLLLLASNKLVKCSPERIANHI